MTNTLMSPNMNLPVPVVGVDPGPDWASDLNSCLSLIDQHDHSPGFGVVINPSGLNINSDLSIGGNNLTSIRSSRYTVQAAALALAADLNCAYVSGVDLYFNDGNGNHIQITQNGGIAGTSGSISNLTSPASASYVAADQTFVWQSDSNVPANMDGASYIFRNLVANSKGLTLNPPNSMAANYSLTLPALPAANGSFVTIATTGAMSSSVVVDNSSLEVSSNTLQVKALGIASTMLAALSVTNAKIANSTIDLTAKVTGTLPVGNGGTGVTACKAHIQTQYQIVTASSTTTTLIPNDTSIPQNTEGAQFLTATITPKSASNLLKITVTVVLAHSTANAQLTAALFQDSTASAIAATQCWSSTTVTGGQVNCHLEYLMAAGTTSATAFKVRCGAGSAGTLTFNTTALGGVMCSSIVIDEYAA